MTLRTVEQAMDDVVPLLKILWGLFPSEYTGEGTLREQKPSAGN